MATYTGKIKGGRWLDIETGLINCARSCGLTIETTRNTNWFMETIKFKVSGSDIAVDRYMTALKTTVNKMKL